MVGSMSTLIADWRFGLIRHILFFNCIKLGVLSGNVYTNIEIVTSIIFDLVHA